MTEDNSQVKIRSATFSMSGLVIGFIALVAAVMSPWILESVSPPTKSIDEVAVDVAINIKDRLVAKAKGQEFVAKAKDDKTPSLRRWYPPVTIGIGLLGMCLGIAGFTRHESTRVSASAVTVGSGYYLHPIDWRHSQRIGNRIALDLSKLNWQAKLKQVKSTTKRMQPKPSVKEPLP